MKQLIIAGVFAITTSAAVAQPFEFQKRIGGPEYDPYESTEGMVFAPVVETGHVSSLTAWMQGADVDGIALHDFRGEIVESGPSRISLYEIQRDSPEGIANNDYYKRYSADTDWDAVARNFRQGRGNEGLASDARLNEGDS